ncbi:Fur family ferric uptake transcriptional regulator [Aequitasia blattaphilus]|uniref:Transcriptional repressor n=1 Tax=Aequitasia blattaphilus TaxID=2949332 RepID=A0ABT1E8A8_9FIRM|nr:transcriptional repressor [Aequitasia blattaphilus]MCP1102053.1 transcriptional repressor [Aequitasia blattaphilus]MCR8614693.1 transcriptional repressor [Aequitasia blattaphilus]
MNKEERVEEAIVLLREKGYRITNQRRVLLKLIIDNEYSSVKEVYYAVKKIDQNVGIATVYRTIQLLESLNLVKKEMTVSF